MWYNERLNPAVLITTWRSINANNTLCPYSLMAKHCLLTTWVQSLTTLQSKWWTHLLDCVGLITDDMSQVRYIAEIKVRILYGATHSDNGALKSLSGKSNHAHKPETVERSRVGKYVGSRHDSYGNADGSIDTISLRWRIRLLGYHSRKLGRRENAKSWVRFPLSTLTRAWPESTA